MKKLLIITLFILCINSVFSQILSVSDIETKQPVELVSITALSPNLIEETNHNGKADITQFKDSKKIEIRRIGYQTVYSTYQKLKEQDFTLHLSPTTFNLDGIVVSATRWSQSANKIPEKIYHISKKDIALMTPQTTADMMQNTGKVFVQKSQLGGGSPMIRGFSTNRLLYTIDGIRMNSAIFRSGNLQNIISIDPYSIEGSEILFGPSSVIYGSDAIGGVMSFQTLKPTFSYTNKPLIKGSVLGKYASANKENSYHIDLNVGWKKISLLTSISTFHFDDLRQGKYGKDDYLKKYIVQNQIQGVDIALNNTNPLIQSPSGYQQTNMMQKIAYKPNDYWLITLGGHYSETSPYPRYDRHNRTRNGLPRYGEWNYGPQIWGMTHLEINHSRSNLFYDQFTARIANQRFEESRIDRAFNKPTRESKKEQVNAYSINIDMKKTVANRHSLYYGVEYVINNVISTGWAEKLTNDSTWDIAPRYPQAHWESLAAYTNMQFRFSDKWTLQTGIRYNHFAIDGRFNEESKTSYQLPYDRIEANNGAATGSLGTVYRPDNSWVISANLSTGFRAPNVDDMGKVFDSVDGMVVVPNPDLKAEYALNGDINIAKIISSTAKIDFSAYYTHLHNALTRTDFTLNGKDSLIYQGTMSRIQAIQNLNQAKVYGVQLGIEYKLPYNWIFSTDINYQKGTNIANNGTQTPSRHTAPLFGNVRLKYHKDKLTMLWYIDYQGERDAKNMPKEEKKKKEIYALDTEGNVYAPAWYTLNFKMNYQINPTLSLSGGVENITDQRYRPYSSGISGAGRNVILSLKANW